MDISSTATNWKPRDLADKSDKQTLKKAIRMALDLENEAVRRNTGTFNTNRYKTVSGISDYEELKQRAREIKEEAIEQLPGLLRLLEENIKKRGGHFYLAKDAADANQYIDRICREHSVRSVVKSKSITSEEIKLNHTLEDSGIEVVETDLAEFILQYADEQPSHIVAPAIHYTRERISELFRRVFNTDEKLETGEELTAFARKKLREKFLKADAGITGANFLAADTGTLTLVESEANIRMVTTLPALHIAVAGVEKVIPHFEDLAVFIELLAASGTGQPLTSYTHFLNPPLKVPVIPFNDRDPEDREFHLVLIDNGRFNMREDPVLKETLYCIRCSACMNSCANFQTVGGHAFGGECYTGGIGGAWHAGTDKLEKARFSELCSGCSRCVPQCPVKIDIPWLNEVLRHRLNQQNQESGAVPYVFKGFIPTIPEDRKASLQKQFFGNYYWLATRGSKWSGLTNTMNKNSLFRSVLKKYAGVDKRRKLPGFTGKPLTKYGDEIKSFPVSDIFSISKKAVLFADPYTNFGHPQNGVAVMKIFKKLGLDIVLSDCLSEGRAALSQGMIPTAKKEATITAQYLKQFLDDERDIVVIEPSVLALFRSDYRHLLDDKILFEELQKKSYEPVEYLLKIMDESGVDPSDVFHISADQKQQPVFYHSHCQQKTTKSDKATKILLKKLGFDLRESNVECCGMAGSFGYKSEFYDISENLGKQLVSQIDENKKSSDNLTVLASGTSCTDQIESFSKYKVIHPVVFLAGLIVNLSSK